MKTAVFSTHKFEKPFLESANNGTHELIYLDTRLNFDTASLANNCEAVSLFVNDDASADVLKKLVSLGVKAIVLRSAGFNNVDLEEANKLRIRIARVPAYSPYSVAEHAVALMLALNRKLVRAHNRIREMNFSLDGLTGFDMNGKTVGIIGTGKIGAIVSRIMHGFGCRVLAFDVNENIEIKEKYKIEYLDLDSVFRQSDIITLHVPMSDKTKHMINKTTLDTMKRGVMLINTSRGGLVNTKEVVQALKTGHLGYLGMDVYEEEEGLFFEDHSENILQDDVIARLMTFQNVLITSHQAFLTETALGNIAGTTIENLNCFAENKSCENELIGKKL
ncbi:MAG: 2-hydroxyacid dehydrogenase [Ferruginibacter sp.]